MIELIIIIFLVKKNKTKLGFRQKRKFHLEISNFKHKKIKSSVKYEIRNQINLGKI